jgi:YidC/Oxa1 family membrane protein insertase
MKKIKITPILLVLLIVVAIVHPDHLYFMKQPLTAFMDWAETAIGGVNAIGWSIVMLTVVVRLILLPLMLHQQRAATIQQEKMRLLQPQLAKVQEAQKNAKTQDEQMRASQAMMTIYRENNVSLLGGMNFGALIIQMPVFFGLYQAIAHAQGMGQASFFGIDLATKNLGLAIATGVAYFVQSYLSMLGIPEDQKKVMKQMLYIMPVMMFFTTYITNAGIGLYFFVGALFMVFQTLIVVLWRPRLRRHVSDTFEVKDVADDALAGRIKNENPQGAFAKAMQQAQQAQAQQAEAAPKDITATATEKPVRQNGRGRNAGKQQRRN